MGNPAGFAGAGGGVAARLRDHRRGSLGRERCVDLSRPGGLLALVIGTSALFGYMIGWALRARADGATLVEINPERTELSDPVDYHLPAPAGLAPPELVGE